MTLIEAELFYDKRRELECLRNISGRFYWYLVVMVFIEWEIFQEKKMNLTVYEKLLIHFICIDSRWYLLEKCSYTILEGTWQFTKDSLSILFAWSSDGIYWREALPRYENEFERLSNVSCRFYWHWVVMAFIEWELFYDKRMNFNVYETFSVDFIGT
jgi:hypothetical protein